MGNTSFDMACRKGQFNDVKRFHYSEMRLFQVFSNTITLLKIGQPMLLRK